MPCLQIIAASVVLSAVCFLGVGCLGTEPEHALRVENLDYKLLPGGARIVSGAIHNDGDVLINVAQVQISLFDSKNRRVDAMHAMVRDVPPGGSVTFREPVQSDVDVNGARVKSVLVLD